MDLDALLHRRPVVPFGPGARIPWDEPGFSARMLREHLSQHHDRASRRLDVVDQQVAWLHGSILGGKPARILDLGCGPGLYTSRLARLGHSCVGLDFSPASIAYAAGEADAEELECCYELADLREAHLGQNFDLAMLLFGEFNTFSPAEAESLLSRVRSALVDAGRLVLEPQSAEGVRATGEEPPSWTAQAAGLFADAPHLTLRECAWHPEHAASTERYFVYCQDEPCTTYAQTTRAYTDAEFDDMLDRAGFDIISRYESITSDDSEAGLFGLVAQTKTGG